MAVAKVNVFIQGGTGPGSWDNPPGSGNTNTQIWNGVRDARNMWNNAVDTTSNPGTTNRPPYQFNEAQAGGMQDADIIIVRDDSGQTAFASSGYDGHPRTIKINSNWAATLTAAELIAAIAHELGHPHGLGNAYVSGSGCTQSTSIMNGLDGSNKPIVKSVQHRDVYQMNQAINNPGNCCADVNALNTLLDQNPNCTDNDADGWCLEVDCNDSDANYQENCPTPTPPEQWCPEQQYPCQPAEAWSETQCRCVCNPMYCTPIIIDVDGNGFQLTDAAGGISFDLTGDGSVEQISWTASASDDALLVLDRNANGVIDGGAECFGGRTPQPPSDSPNGFRALGVFDQPGNGGNNDGVIDRDDAIFASLRLWQDTNHDGYSDAWELHPLPSLDVAVLHLTYKVSKRTDEYGNQFRYRAKVDDARKATVSRWAWDVILVKAP